MSDDFSVVAIISAFNEDDIIDPVVGHLVENGVGVYLIDDHSTDDTQALARQWLGRGVIGVETLPQEQPEDTHVKGFNWSAILRRKEELARELSASWFIHHDADEIRESPWPGMSLKEAIRWVDRQGYNCIDFRVFNFVPIDDGFRRGDDPRTYFSYYESAADFDKLQIKAWKATSAPVSLLPSGGHEATFEGRRVFPIPFLLRHYPIRGQTHGVRKVFTERKGRFLPSERAQGWHVQYEQIENEKYAFVRDPAELERFDLDRARLRCILPDRALLDLSERLTRAHADLDTVRGERDGIQQGLEEYRSHATNLETERARLLAANQALEADHARLNEAIRNLDCELKQQQQAVAQLEATHAELVRKVDALEQGRKALAEGLAKSDQARSAVEQSLEQAEHARSKAEDEVAALEGEIAQLRASRSWRWTAPFRQLHETLHKK